MTAIEWRGEAKRVERVPDLGKLDFDSIISFPFLSNIQVAVLLEKFLNFWNCSDTEDYCNHLKLSYWNKIQFDWAVCFIEKLVSVSAFAIGISDQLVAAWPAFADGSQMWFSHSW